MAILGLTSRLTSLLMFPGERSPHLVELDPMTSFRSKGWQVKITKEFGGEVRAILAGGFWVVPCLPPPCFPVYNAVYHSNLDSGYRSFLLTQ